MCMKSIEYKISNSLCSLELQFPIRQKKRRKKKNLADLYCECFFFPPFLFLKKKRFRDRQKVMFILQDYSSKNFLLFFFLVLFLTFIRYKIFFIKKFNSILYLIGSIHYSLFVSFFSPRNTHAYIEYE